MARIQIKGIRHYDGDYELDTDRAFNAREWRWIKKVSGYMPLTVGDGFAGGDPDLFVALAVIAMCREGKIDRESGLTVADELAEMPFDGAAITLIGDDVEADELPLDLTRPPDESSPNATSENHRSSGEPSRSDSAPSGGIPPAISLSRSPTS